MPSSSDQMANLPHEKLVNDDINDIGVENHDDTVVLAVDNDAYVYVRVRVRTRTEKIAAISIWKNTAVSVEAKAAIKTIYTREALATFENGVKSSARTAVVASRPRNHHQTGHGRRSDVPWTSWPR
jgi:hypothetical protein